MSDTRYEYQSEFAKKYFGQGLAEGREEGREEGRDAMVRSLLRLLDRRHLVLSPEERLRIESCTDLATLEQWIERAGDAAAASELFDA